MLTNLLLQPLGSMSAVVDVRWHSRLPICDHDIHVPYLSASFACIRCLISLATLLAMLYHLLQHFCMKQTGKLVPHVAALDNLPGSCNSAVATVTKAWFDENCIEPESRLRGMVFNKCITHTHTVCAALLDRKQNERFLVSLQLAEPTSRITFLLDVKCWMSIQDTSYESRSYLMVSYLKLT